MNNRNDWALIAALVFVGAAAAVFAYVDSGSGLWSDTTATWVQAIGTVLAVIGAGYWPRAARARDKAEERLERRLRARGLAVYIQPTILALTNNATFASEHLAKAKDRPLDELPQILKFYNLSIPESLTRFLPDYYLLGEVLARNVVATIEAFDEVVIALAMIHTLGIHKDDAPIKMSVDFRYEQLTSALKKAETTGRFTYYKLKAFDSQWQ